MVSCDIRHEMSDDLIQYRPAVHGSYVGCRSCYVDMEI